MKKIVAKEKENLDRWREWGRWGRAVALNCATRWHFEVPLWVQRTVDCIDAYSLWALVFAGNIGSLSWDNILSNCVFFTNKYSNALNLGHTWGSVLECNRVWVDVNRSVESWASVVKEATLTICPLCNPFSWSSALLHCWDTFFCILT